MNIMTDAKNLTATAKPAGGKLRMTPSEAFMETLVAHRVKDVFGRYIAKQAAERLLKRLTLIRHAPSLGGVDTIVSEPRFTSHAHLSADERAAAGIPDGFIRMSVGVEAAADLIADLEGALGA